MALIGSFGIKNCMKMCYDKIDKLGFRGCEWAAWRKQKKELI